jgi:NitT/TauT family transport system substrate-binding protein
MSCRELRAPIRLLVLAVAVFVPCVAAWGKDRVRVAEGPFITGGGLFIAQAKGYFDKEDIAVEIRKFEDGALALPALIAGELDITFLPAAANLFNSVAKGAPIVVFLDRGNNEPGRAYSATSVSQVLADQGVRTIADFAKLKGKRAGVAALGSINQYTLSLGLIKAGLNPATDVRWTINVPQPDLMKMLGQDQVDVIDVAYNIAKYAENNNWGPIAYTGDAVASGGQIATYAVRKDFLAEHRDVLVRWVVAYLQGAREFNAAAADPTHHPDIVDILAKNTVLNRPELVTAIAPHWAYLNEEGRPNVESIMAMQDFWSGPYYKFIAKKVTQGQLFDLTVARDANTRLNREKR